MHCVPSATHSWIYPGKGTLRYAAGMDHNQAFQAVKQSLDKAGLRIIREDRERPWGGFFVIDESQAAEFIAWYFPEEDAAQLTQQKVSPKILLVAPGKRLSWQYHHRRAELWRIIEGDADVAMSQTDEQGTAKTHHPGDIVRLTQGRRHRLIGREGWGIVAEIWQHTDPNHPSDEDDIVRLQDDFGRG